MNTYVFCDQLWGSGLDTYGRRPPLNMICTAYPSFVGETQSLEAARCAIALENSGEIAPSGVEPFPGWSSLTTFPEWHWFHIPRRAHSECYVLTALRSLSDLLRWVLRVTFSVALAYITWWRGGGRVEPVH
jgi:hypothetical protein